MAHDFTFFRYRKEGKIAYVTINRPDVLNAFHYPAVRELKRLADLVADDPDMRIVAITGEGRAFSTGMDLKELPKGEVDIGYHDKWERALRRFETMDKIVLCLIHGYAIGGGLQLALACDIRASTRSGRYRRLYTGLGIAPDTLGLIAKVKAAERSYFDGFAAGQGGSHPGTEVRIFARRQRAERAERPRWLLHHNQTSVVTKGGDHTIRVGCFSVPDPRFLFILIYLVYRPLLSGFQVRWLHMVAITRYDARLWFAMEGACRLPLSQS